MNRESRRGPIVFLPNGTQKRVEGFKDLKIGDVFSVEGLPKRRVIGGPTREVKNGKICWNIKTESIALIQMDQASWEAGFKQGEAGQSSLPVPKGLDSLSWTSGYIDGAAKRKRNLAEGR